MLANAMIKMHSLSRRALNLTHICCGQERIPLFRLRNRKKNGNFHELREEEMGS
jgi:hypothetical protein